MKFLSVLLVLFSLSAQADFLLTDELHCEISLYANSAQDELYMYPYAASNLGMRYVEHQGTKKEAMWANVNGHDTLYVAGEMFFIFDGDAGLRTFYKIGGGVFDQFYYADLYGKHTRIQIGEAYCRK